MSEEPGEIECRTYSVFLISVNERVESGHHFLELALHVLVVEELVCGYQTLIQIQCMLACLQEIPERGGGD